MFINYFAVNCVLALDNKLQEPTAEEVRTPPALDCVVCRAMCGGHICCTWQCQYSSKFYDRTLSLLPAATSVDERRTAAQTENDGVGKPRSLPR